MGAAHPYPPPYHYPYAIVFWAVFFAVFVPEVLIVRRAGRQPPAAQDRGSLRLILIGNMVGTWVAFICPFLFPRSMAAGAGGSTMFWTGIGLMVVGSALRHHCFRVLGASFKPTVHVSDDQAVVARGAYRYLRHPSYAAAMILFLGVGLALANWVSVIVMAVMVSVVYGYRIHVEEAALVATLGESYRGYMARTKRIIPFIW